MALLSANRQEILDSKRLTGYRRGSQCDESLETPARTYWNVAIILEYTRFFWIVPGCYWDYLVVSITCWTHLGSVFQHVYKFVESSSASNTFLHVAFVTLVVL